MAGHLGWCSHQALLTYIAFIAFICYGSFACSIGAALPDIALRLRADETSLGIVFTARGCGYVFGTLLYSSIAEAEIGHLIKFALIAASVLIGGIGSNILSTSCSLHVILICVFCLSGLFSGVDILCNILLPSMWGVEVQPWLHALHACWSVGGILGPLLIGWVGYKQANIIQAVVCLVPGLMLLYVYKTAAAGFVVSKPINDADVENPNQVLHMQRKCSAGNIARSSELKPSELKKNSLSNELRANFFIFYFFYVGLESGYGGWVSSYAINLGLSSSQSAYIASLFYFSISIGRIVSVPLSLRYQPSMLIRMQLSITVAGAALAVYVQRSGLGSGSLFLTCATATITIGYGISSIFPIGLTLVHEYMLIM